jgi:hypothetical protein
MLPSDFDFAEIERLSCLAWVTKNSFVNENQKPFEFTKHRFMIEPYDDIHPDQVIRKSAQVGWSVAAILKSLHAAKFLGLNVIYVLPTRNATHDFVIPKVNPMIDRNPEIRAIVAGTDSTNLKKVGDRFIYYRGSFHRGEAISTTADLIVSDEHDISDQGVLDIYQSRLQASEFGWFWRFSNPTLPGFGVDELFQESDQKHWFVRCRHCGHRMYLDFLQDNHVKNHYIDPERRLYACGKCHGELTNDDRRSGEWIAKFPSRSRRGYWLNQLMVPWVSANKILGQKEKMSIDVFHNFVLGMPYQASEYLINREAIMRANHPQQASKTDVVIGCDSGKEKHWVAGNRDGIFAYGKTHDWGDIERLINMYNATTVIDALPDFTIPEQLARKYPGQVFVHYYSPDNSASMDISHRKEGTEFGVIQSDRTKLFDVLAADITSGKIQFFQDPKSLTDLIYHFENIYRVVEPDTRGIMKAKWEHKENKPDHWAHAAAYYKVGLGFMIGLGEVGGVKPLQPAGKKKPAYHVRPDGTVPVREALGRPLDDLVAKSLARNKKRRVL